MSAIPFEDFFELNASGRTRGHKYKLKETKIWIEPTKILLLPKSCQRMERVGGGGGERGNGGLLQEKIGKGNEREDGPLYGLDPNGPGPIYMSGVIGRTW